jgi:hypothetical protein
LTTFRSAGALVCVMALSACAERPFQRSAGVPDSTCIRQASVADIDLWEAVRDCGTRLPDLSDDPGLQRQASLSGIPFIRKTHPADGNTRTYVCRGAPPTFERMDTPYPSVGRCTALGS